MCALTEMHTYLDLRVKDLICIKKSEIVKGDFFVTVTDVSFCVILMSKVYK